MRQHLLLGMCILVSGSLLSACGDNTTHKNLKKYVEKVKRRPAQAIDPLPKFVEIKQHQYPEQPRRNPFKPASRASLVSGKGGPDLKREKQPLEAFPLDSLEYVGLMEQDKRIWAIVTAPDGIAYRISVGGFLGKQFGRVTKISADELNVVERIRVGDKWEKRPIKMKLAAEDK